ncbi:DUF4224 domain-containing protein [Alcaligenaceae bacterium]|nr:DUF4224 domain-containing protein [Alcaligenaceae bacterium]
MDTTFLSDSEVEGLTGRTRRDAQVRALRYMGIEHRERPDGSVAILRSHVEQVLGYAPTKKKPAYETEPNWSAI